GDDSGTHSAELRLWEIAETRPQDHRIFESGQGMAATLRIASERNAYTLTDYPTYLRLRDTLELAIIYQREDPALLNCYALTVPAGPRNDAAAALAEWLSRGGGRELITSFRIDGEQPFRIWPHDVPDDHPEAVPRP
ncbi:MAG: sulfate transporter, partial [Acidobacteria bacterium]|nr:sulfate transporter [Acidobacteriota bacterium]